MPLKQSELEPLLNLALVEGVGPQRLAMLVRRFGSATATIGASVRELRCTPGIGEEIARRIRAAAEPAAAARARRALERLERLGASVLTPGHDAYPVGIRNLSDRPYLLYVAGDLACFRVPAIAVVGTRAPTAYGVRMAERLSADLTGAGYAVVSGLARGIDSAAHRGAIQGGGSTVAVLGHGIDQVYPPENRMLFRELREKGLLVTEYPPGETPKPGNFPRRNRLIAALSEAVVVVEMGHQSGAQHTVGYALEQGKDVLSVPGPIGSRASEGTNQLIKDGSPLITSAADVIEQVHGVGAVDFDRAQEAGFPRHPIATAAGSESQPLALPTATEEKILASLSPLPAHIDELTAATGISAAELSSHLLQLELRGLVEAFPGKRFSRG